jgi:hypothetical protein
MRAGVKQGRTAERAAANATAETKLARGKTTGARWPDGCPAHGRGSKSFVTAMGSRASIDPPRRIGAF